MITNRLHTVSYTHLLISLGGNIVAVGEKGKSMENGAGSEFSVGIADPDSDTGQLLGIVPCKDKTVVTSGTYERYFEIDGELYHHCLLYTSLHNVTLQKAQEWSLPFMLLLSEDLSQR